MRVSSLAVTVSGFALFAAPALAQETVDEAAEDIILVTAQKRSQAQVDVPIAITAYSGDQLERIGIDEFDELSAYVPGLNVQEQSANNPGFVIRGITSDSGSAQQSARVTIYYNGVDVSRSRGSYFDLFDIERIEVVKGPQATLFGTAAAIGAISVISARPEPGLAARASAAYGNLDQTRFAAMLNTGNDRVAGRVAFAWKQRDGFIRNIAGEPGSSPVSRTDQADLNGQDQLGMRGSLRVWPTDTSTIDLIVTYDRQRNPGTSFKSGTLPPSGGAADPFSFAELGGSPVSRAVLGLEKLGLKRDVYDVNLSFETALSDSWTLSSVSGYREFDSLEVFDADGSAAFYLEFAEDAQGKQMSHETRISYEGERLRGFGGFNLFHEDGFQRVPFSTEEGTYIACTPGFGTIQAMIGNPGCVNAAGVVTAAAATSLLTGGAFDEILYSSEFTNGGKNSAYSVFADVTFIPVPAIELTAGGRYVWEDRKSLYSARQPVSTILSGFGLPISLLPVADTGGQTFSSDDTSNAFLPRVNVLFRATDEVNLFATVSRGRRSPVVDLSARATPAGPVAARRDIPAEKVWNYEGGIKGRAGPVNGSLSAFYQTYDNFQVSVVEGGQIVPRNAGSATNWGIEAETSVRFSPAIRLFANGAYIDAGIDDKPANGIFAGDRFRLQPKWQGAAGLDIDLTLTDGVELTLNPSVTYRSQLFFEVPNSPQISEDAVTLVNVRGGISFGSGRYAVNGFATNLFDKKYIIDAGNTGGSFGRPTFIAAEPALYGIEVAVRF